MVGGDTVGVGVECTSLFEGGGRGVIDGGWVYLSIVGGGGRGL